MRPDDRSQKGRHDTVTRTGRRPMTVRAVPAAFQHMYGRVWELGMDGSELTRLGAWVLAAMDEAHRHGQV